MFSILNTSYKRKSASITFVILCLLVLALFFVGMKYLDPPEEYGIAVNFGTSEVGSGNIQPTKLLKTAEKPVKEQSEFLEKEVVETKKSEVTSAADENVITQNTEDAIAIKKKKEAQRIADELAIKEKAKQAEAAKKKAEELEKRKKLDALIGGINNTNGKETNGEGNDNEPGDKGKLTGDPNATGYYGNGGGNGDGNYQLGNRKPLNRPKPNYICNEEGLVVVNIEVDTQGKVIKAVAGVKGSTNTAICLLSQAKEAALNTRWQPDANAPSKQIGTIKYRFSLSQ